MDDVEKALSGIEGETNRQAALNYLAAARAALRDDDDEVRRLLHADGYGLLQLRVSMATLWTALREGGFDPDSWLARMIEIIQEL